MQRHIIVKSLREPDDSLAYWLATPVEDRITAVEALRHAYFSQIGLAEQPFQQVCVFKQRTREVEKTR